MPFGFEIKENERKQEENNKSFNGYKKKYVSVQCLHTADAQMIPQVVIFDALHKYEIDKVIDARNAASLKVGGQGIRYTVRILNTETYLFYEKNEHRWFVEQKVGER